MKFSWVKFPILFDFFYSVGMIVSMLILFFLNDQNNFMTVFEQVITQTNWICWLGILIHAVSFIANNHHAGVFWANLLGIEGFLLGFMMPHFFWIGLLSIWLAMLILTLTTRRQPKDDLTDHRPGTN